MLEAGEDPMYVARRMVRMASEDIGLAEPGALAVTLAAKDAFDFLGQPEGNLALAQAAVYLSLAPKSNALYVGYGAVSEDLQETIAEPVPLHLRNAATGLMKNLGYGKGYQYAHNAKEKVTDMTCFARQPRGSRPITRQPTRDLKRESVNDSKKFGESRKRRRKAIQSDREKK